MSDGTPFANWISRNKFQYNFNQNSNVNLVYRTEAILLNHNTLWWITIGLDNDMVWKTII